MSNDLKTGFLTLGIFLFTIIGLALGIQSLEVLIRRVPIEVKVDGRVVYNGPSVGVDVESAGSATIVRVNGGFLYMVPHARYVSRNVHVQGHI